ncbi:MAG: hypothetical protein ABIL09_22240 [Gemmatimonadota bacterium]
MSQSQPQERPSPLSRFMSGGAPGPDPRAAAAEGDGAEPDFAGEVVESSTLELTAQARRLHGAPSFGRFVGVDSEATILGIVFNTYTQSVEPNRRPTAYGKTEAELRLEQPQIFELLRTYFQVLVIGYLDGGEPVHLLPPQPARIHSFVRLGDDDLVRACTESDEFLRCIHSAAHTPTDDLLIAALRHAVRARHHDRAYLVRMGKELARLLRDDYDRLGSVMRRLGAALPA